MIITSAKSTHRPTASWWRVLLLPEQKRRCWWKSLDKDRITTHDPNSAVSFPSSP